MWHTITPSIGTVWFLSYRTLTSKAPTTAEAAEQPKSEDRGKRAAKAVAGAMVGLLIVCAIFAAADNFIKDGLNTWTPVILKEQFGFGDGVSMVMTLVLPLFGVFGSILALQTNRWIKDFRALMGFFYLLLSVCLLGVMLSMQKNTVVLFLVCQGLIACLAHGINAVLTTIMPLALREKINSGSLAGLMNAACYVGSTASAYGLGKIADGNGWDTVMIVLLIVAGSAVVLTGAVLAVGKWNHIHSRHKKSEEGAKLA